MRSVSANRSKKQVTFTLPVEIQERAVDAAQSLGMSLSAWLKMVVGSAVRRWENPVDASKRID